MIQQLLIQVKTYVTSYEITGELFLQKITFNIGHTRYSIYNSVSYELIPFNRKVIIK